ncbi:hypothetical protein YC2023_088821 [Brassica napus]
MKVKSGQKYFQQIEHEMVEELSIPVTLSEVFIKTHTKKDGTFEDLKAERCFQNDPQISIKEDNEIFLWSTFRNERGQHYGIGSLQQTLVNRKQKLSEFSSSAFLDMKKLLEEAHRKIEEQAASNERTCCYYCRAGCLYSRAIKADQGILYSGEVYGRN